MPIKKCKVAVYLAFQTFLRVGMEEISFFVYWCWGLENISLLEFISTALPKYRTITLSLICFAMLKSWVMKINDNFNSFCKDFNKLITCPWIETSNAETGSSPNARPFKKVCD